MLPKDIAKLVPKNHLMTEEEWRGIGVQQSHGWEHYMLHNPGIINIFNAYFILLTFMLWKLNSFIVLNFRTPYPAVQTIDISGTTDGAQAVIFHLHVLYI